MLAMDFSLDVSFRAKIPVALPEGGKAMARAPVDRTIYPGEVCKKCLVGGKIFPNHAFSRHEIALALRTDFFKERRSNIADQETG